MIAGCETDFTWKLLRLSIGRSQLKVSSSESTSNDSEWKHKLRPNDWHDQQTDILLSTRKSRAFPMLLDIMLKYKS